MGRKLSLVVRQALSDPYGQWLALFATHPASGPRLQASLQAHMLHRLGLLPERGQK